MASTSITIFKHFKTKSINSSFFSSPSKLGCETKFSLPMNVLINQSISHSSQVKTSIPDEMIGKKTFSRFFGYFHEFSFECEKHNAFTVTEVRAVAYIASGPGFNTSSLKNDFLLCCKVLGKTWKPAILKLFGVSALWYNLKLKLTDAAKVNESPNNIVWGVKNSFWGPRPSGKAVLVLWILSHTWDPITHCASVCALCQRMWISDLQRLKSTDYYE